MMQQRRDEESLLATQQWEQLQPHHPTSHMHTLKTHSLALNTSRTPAVDPVHGYVLLQHSQHHSTGPPLLPAARGCA